MSDDVVTTLLPVLSRSLEARFNVFDVMRHGSHEKQLSNVFAWLLDAGGTHRLGDRFLRIFLDEVNGGLLEGEPFDMDEPYRVSQEANTAGDGLVPDIADIVLHSKDAVLVVENYFTSDGHGHSYDGYLRFGSRDGLRAAVVLLCRDEDRSLLLAGWERAAVVTYGALVGRLLDDVGDDREYRRTHDESFSFISQMHRKFAKGNEPMEDRDVLDFVLAMCRTGEADRYGESKHDLAAERFARDISQQAQERFGEGRGLLSKVKDRLATFTRQVLRPQLVHALGDGAVGAVKANWAGAWRWSVIIELNNDVPGDSVSLRFGPTVRALQQHLGRSVDGVDYSLVFTWYEARQELRPSPVSMQDVLDGLDPNDTRLRDAIADVLRCRGGDIIRH